MRESKVDVAGVRSRWRRFGCLVAGIFAVGFASCGQGEGADSVRSTSTTQVAISRPDASNTTNATPSTGSPPSVADCIEARDLPWPEAVTSDLPWPGAEGLLEVHAKTTARTVGEVTGLQAAADHLGMTIEAADPLSWDEEVCDLVLDGPRRMRVSIGELSGSGQLVLDFLDFGAGSFPGVIPIGDEIQFEQLLEGGQASAGCVEETSVRFGDIEATATGVASAPITVIVPGRPPDLGGRIVRRATCEGQVVRLLAWGVPSGDFAAG